MDLILLPTDACVIKVHEELPQTRVPGKENLSAINCPYFPLWSLLSYIAPLKNLNLGFWVNPIQSTSVAPCVREWVIQFDHAFQVGTGTVNVSMQATGDKMWLFMSQCCHAHWWQSSMRKALKDLSWSRFTTNPFPRPLSKMVFIFPFRYWLWYKNPFKSENPFKSPKKNYV